VFLFISFFVLFGALISLVVNIYEQNEPKNKQLQLLEADVQKEVDKNIALKTALETVKSDTYIEKEARNKLGYAYPNEQLYILKKTDLSPAPSSIPSSVLGANTSSAQEGSNSSSILSQWLDIIFGQ